MGFVGRKSVNSGNVFIVGCHGSGTTAIHNVLLTHPSIYGSHPRFQTRLYTPQAGTKEWWNYYERVLRNLLRIRTIDALQDQYSKLSRQEFLISVLSLFKEDFKNICEERTPEHLYYLDDIKKDWPESIVVCTLRDSEATIRSMCRNLFRKKQDAFKLACEEYMLYLNKFNENYRHITFYVVFENFCKESLKVTDTLQERMGLSEFHTPYSIRTRTLLGKRDKIYDILSDKEKKYIAENIVTSKIYNGFVEICENEQNSGKFIEV